MSSRRGFCVQACRAGLAAALWVPACAHAASRAQDRPISIPTIKGDVDGSTVRVPTRSTPLASVGGFARVVSNAGSFLVTRSSERTFLVVSATCSHEACLITDMDGKIFVCPCHGSRFDGQGNVL